MFTVYIIKSLVKNRYYIGYTENMDERIRSHNTGKVRSTKAYGPWEIAYSEVYSNKEDAYRREKQIKSYKSGAAFKNLISND